MSRMLSFMSFLDTDVHGVVFHTYIHIDAVPSSGQCHQNTMLLIRCGFASPSFPIGYLPTSKVSTGDTYVEKLMRICEAGQEMNVQAFRLLSKHRRPDYETLNITIAPAAVHQRRVGHHKPKWPQGPNDPCDKFVLFISLNRMYVDVSSIDKQQYERFVVNVIRRCPMSATVFACIAGHQFANGVLLHRRTGRQECMVLGSYMFRVVGNTITGHQKTTMVTVYNTVELSPSLAVAKRHVPTVGGYRSQSPQCPYCLYRFCTHKQPACYCTVMKWLMNSLQDRVGIGGKSRIYHKTMPVTCCNKCAFMRVLWRPWDCHR